MALVDLNQLAQQKNETNNNARNNDGPADVGHRWVPQVTNGLTFAERYPVVIEFAVTGFLKARLGEAFMLCTIARLLRAPSEVDPLLRHVFINSLGLWIGCSLGALRALLGFCLVPLGSRAHVDHPELSHSKP
jgi:hypothetical protein